MTFWIETLRLGLSNLMLHKLRSLLTALGIIFGVASVITMVAIGEGNKRKALADIRELGATNIIVRSVKPPASQSMGEGTQRLSQYGILRRDLRRIVETVHPVTQVVPLKQVGNRVHHGIHTAPAEVFGTTPELLKAASLQVARGRYLSDQDMHRLDNVAVIGAEVATRLFPLSDPLGNTLMVDDQTYQIVGILQRIGLAGGAGSALVGRDLNFDIHIPMPAARSRFGDVRLARSSGSFDASQVEIKELIIQVSSEEQVMNVASQIQRILGKEHAQQGDVTTIVPLELLRQAEKTQAMFNALLIAIASISLLVGGIGIMNIMLASVTERTREIGVRRALGATRHHIIAQFLVETTALSGIGGLIGVGLGLLNVLGLALAYLWWGMMEMPYVTTWSIMVSFIVATSVGVIFGLYPAIQASKQDPIVALRHD